MFIMKTSQLTSQLFILVPGFRHIKMPQAIKTLKISDLRSYNGTIANLRSALQDRVFILEAVSLEARPAYRSEETDEFQMKYI